MNILNWLEKWYKSNCDDRWEHEYGVKIETLDNPGWNVEIDLTGTPLMNKPFEKIKIINSDDDWIHCRVQNAVFEGFGDPFKLEKILNIFKEWVESR